jgi:hypothetical protein
VTTERPILFMTVWNGAAIIAIAAVDGVDEQFAGVLSDEWLKDRSRIISHEVFFAEATGHRFWYRDVEWPSFS